jgi:acylphosphatase
VAAEKDRVAAAAESRGADAAQGADAARGADDASGEGHVRRMHLVYGGDCQGVGFRWNSQRVAVGLGLTGWVRNLDDGSTEVEIQGPDAKIGQFYTGVAKEYQRFNMSPVIKESVEVRPVSGETTYDIRF